MLPKSLNSDFGPCPADSATSVQFRAKLGRNASKLGRSPNFGHHLARCGAYSAQNAKHWRIPGNMCPKSHQILTNAPKFDQHLGCFGPGGVTEHKIDDLGQIRTESGRTWPKFGRHCLNFGRFGRNHQNLASPGQRRSKLDQHWSKSPQFGPNLANLGPNSAEPARNWPKLAERCSSSRKTRRPIATISL